MERLFRTSTLSKVLGFTVACMALTAGSAAAATSAPQGTLSAGPAKTVSGRTTLHGPPLKGFVNRPTVALAQYNAAKANHAPAKRPGAAAPTSPTPLTVASSFGFNGIAQPGSDSTWPSDSNGAYGNSQLVETVNSHLVSYSSSTGAQLSNRSFATLTGYSTKALFDPRVEWDANFRKFVATVEAFPENATVQHYFIMFSKTSDAAGPWIVYDLNVGTLCGTTSPLWDYPQLGETQDALILTANCFDGNTYNGAKVIGIAKAIIFNSLGFSVPVFGLPPADGTATPANVYDQNPTNMILTTAQHMVAFTNPQGGGYGAIASDRVITGFEALAAPRAAGQAGCAAASCTLDTGDGRFVNDSSQYGDKVWNVATYGFGGSAGSFATPYWGQFSIAGASTTQFGALITTACSDDFNASIVANTSDKVWMNWTSTDPQGSTCGQTFVRQMEAGRVSSTAAGSVSNTINPFTSPAELTGNFDSNFGRQRWGDTSATVLSGNSAFSINNSVLDANDWGTRWQKVTQ